MLFCDFPILIKTKWRTAWCFAGWKMLLAFLSFRIFRTFSWCSQLGGAPFPPQVRTPFMIQHGLEDRVTDPNTSRLGPMAGSRVQAPGSSQTEEAAVQRGHCQRQNPETLRWSCLVVETAMGWFGARGDRPNLVALKGQSTILLAPKKEEWLIICRVTLQTWHQGDCHFVLVLIRGFPSMGVPQKLEGLWWFISWKIL